MLTAHHIHKTYGIQPILKDISFSISSRERIGLIGPNGCGKTTLLRILAGIEQADSGTVVSTRPGLRIGYLAQGLDFEPGQTLQSMLNLNPVPRADRESEIESLATALTANPGNSILQTRYEAAILQFSNSQPQASSLLASLGLSDLPCDTPVIRVEEIENHWLQGILNEILSEPNTELMDGLEVVMVNNLPMVMINTSSYSSYNVMYSPKDDAFWLMRRGDPTLVDYPSSEYWFGRMFYSSSEHIPMFLGQLTTNGTAVQYWLPDYENTQTLTGKIFTPIIDFRNNRRKHLARVDVLGDFGVNSTITLKAYKGAGYSDGPETAAPSRTTTVYDDTTNPISFYNFGTYRRFGLVTEISGVDQWQYEGLEIEYNLGMD